MNGEFVHSAYLADGVNSTLCCNVGTWIHSLRLVSPLVISSFGRGSGRRFRGTHIAWAVTKNRFVMGFLER